MRCVLYTNIDQKLVNSLHRLLNCEIGGLDCCVITTEYRARVDCIPMYHLFCNALVHVMYSTVSGQCTYTIRGVYIFKTVRLTFRTFTGIAVRCISTNLDGSVCTWTTLTNMVYITAGRVVISCIWNIKQMNKLKQPRQFELKSNKRYSKSITSSPLVCIVTTTLHSRIMLSG